CHHSFAGHAVEVGHRPTGLRRAPDREDPLIHGGRRGGRATRSHLTSLTGPGPGAGVTISKSEAGSKAMPNLAWTRLLEGNRRFVDDDPQHPNQDTARHEELWNQEKTVVTPFGRSDSGVAAEMVLDVGLGALS